MGRLPPDGPGGEDGSHVRASLHGGRSRSRRLRRGLVAPEFASFDAERDRPLLEAALAGSFAKGCELIARGPNLPWVVCARGQILKRRSASNYTRERPSLAEEMAFGTGAGVAPSLGSVCDRDPRPRNRPRPPAPSRRHSDETAVVARAWGRALCWGS